MSLIFIGNPKTTCVFRKYASEHLSYLKTEDEVDSYISFLQNNTRELLKNDYKHAIVKGEVQSGKTNNLIYTITEFYEQGGEVVLFFSGVTNKLDTQNKLRIVHALKEIYGNDGISINKKHTPNLNVVRNLLNNDRKVAVFSIKRKESIISFINRFKDTNIKTMIIIDEADNTNTSYGWAPLVEKAANVLNTKIIEITATPYKNLYFNNKKYDKYVVFESPKQYQGLKQLINKYQIESADKNNTKVIKETVLRYIVDSAKHLKSEFLINIYHTNKDQKEIKNMLMDFFNDIYHSKKDKPIIKMFEQLDYDPLDALQKIKDFAENNRNSIMLLNGDSDDDMDISKKIFIGDFIMNRGVTFDNLISQIFLKYGNKMDPARLMQSSRWFGYNRPVDLQIVITDEMWEAYKEILKVEKFLESYKLTMNFKEWFDGMDFEHIEIGGKNE